MSENGKLAGKVCIVTGATSGIGKATAARCPWRTGPMGRAASRASDCREIGVPWHAATHCIQDGREGAHQRFKLRRRERLHTVTHRNFWVGVDFNQ